MTDFSNSQTASPAVGGAVKYNPDGTRVLSGPEQEMSEYWNERKPMTPAQEAAEEERIRQEHLQQQQQAIVGINSMYDNLLGQINKDNAGRLGSTASINALSGQRGSASGLANEDKMMQHNQSIVAANEAERNAKINQVMSDYKNRISQEVMKAKELRTADANAWLEYKGQEVERNKANSLELRKAFIAAGMAPEDLDDDVYNEIAVNAGYSLAQAKAVYKSEYESKMAEFVAAEEKNLATLEKTRAETEKIRAEAGEKSQENIMLKIGRASCRERV